MQQGRHGSNISEVTSGQRFWWRGRQNFNTHKWQKKPARPYLRFQDGENGAKETNKSASQQLVNNKSTKSQQVNNKSTTNQQQVSKSTTSQQINNKSTTSQQLVNKSTTNQQKVIKSTTSEQQVNNY